MELTEYLSQTKYAVSQLFENLQFYKALYQEVIEATRKTKSFLFDDYNSEPDNPDYKKEFERFVSENKESGRRQSEAISKLEGADVSSNAIAGAIIQIGFMAVKIFSNNAEVPEPLKKIHNNLSPGLQKTFQTFAVGRNVWGEVPLGLVLYAGRNQYNHFDEHENGYNNLVETVFKRINNYGRESLAFEISPVQHQEPQNVAKRLLGVLNWRNYDDFERDILDAVSR